MRNILHIPSRGSLLCVAVATLLCTACNKDEFIEEPIPEEEEPVYVVPAPVISLDSESGVYATKVGREVTIAPTVENTEDAVYSWIIDEQEVGTDSTITLTFDRAGEVFVLFRVENPGGKAEEELRIDVAELAPPVISLAWLAEGYKVLLERDYELAPDIANRNSEGFAVEWFCNGEKVCDQPAWTFNATEAGEYAVTVRAVNEDGEDIREFTIQAVDHLPWNVYFQPRSPFDPSTDKTVFVGKPLFLQPIVQNFSPDNTQYVWLVDGKVVSDATTKMFKFVPAEEGEFQVTVKVIDLDWDEIRSATVVVRSYPERN